MCVCRNMQPQTQSAQGRGATSKTRVYSTLTNDGSAPVCPPQGILTLQWSRAPVNARTKPRTDTGTHMPNGGRGHPRLCLGWRGGIGTHTHTHTYHCAMSTAFRPSERAPPPPPTYARAHRPKGSH